MARCEDTDPDCLFCSGHCTREATCTLHRVDSIDKTGTEMCDECSEDALASGVFRVQELDARLDSQLRLWGWVNA